MNGSPTKEFKPKKWLRQGDMMTPFLFLIVAKGLAGIVRHALCKNVFEGVRVGLDGVEVSLLQFGDDTLFFTKPRYQNIMVIKSIIRCFELISGLRVNFNKSQIRAINVEVGTLHHYSTILNFSRMQILFKYMGMTIGRNLEGECLGRCSGGMIYW